MSYFQMIFFSASAILLAVYTAQKMKFSIKDFFSKYDQILIGKLYFLCRVTKIKSFWN